MRLLITTAIIALAMTLASAGLRAEDAPIMLKGGAYEVEMKLELPHLEEIAQSRTETICVAASADGANAALPVLSRNNPLGKCPATNLRQEGDRLTFEIGCAGGNAARGFAAYTLAPEQFHGRIKMTMGGKNMTMSEVQTGHRVGDCSAVARMKRSEIRDR